MDTKERTSRESAYVALILGGWIGFWLGLTVGGVISP